MSNSRIPCSDRPLSPGRQRGHEMVSLEVSRGKDSEVLEAPLRHLRNTSKYFNNQLDGTSENFAVPHGSPHLFRILIEFFKTGCLHQPDSNEETDRRFSFSALIEIYGFAKDFEIFTLRNAALDEFFLRILDNPDELPYKHIFDIYKATSSNSSLRSLTVDAVVNIGMKQKVQDWEDELPKEFMMDCLTAASEDGIVPFPRDRSHDDITNWLEDMKEELCDLFHVHDRAVYQEWRAPRIKPFVKTRNARGRRRARRREAQAREGLDEDEEEMDPERQKLVDEEAAERMRYLMVPLPVRQRY